MKAEKHPLWKGPEATAQVKRKRAQRWYSLDDVTCERDGCDKPAEHRHHVNGDTGDNRRTNLEFLCVKCHQRRHHPIPDPTPCINCGRLIRKTIPTRCGACQVYKWRNGRERPWKADGRKEGASVFHPRPPKPLVPCTTCGDECRPRKGMCQRCYDAARYAAKKRAA